MPSDRTFVTEIATGLGMLGQSDIAQTFGRRSLVLADLEGSDWERLEALWHARTYADEFSAGFDNGLAFLAARDALNHRVPRIIEWTGGRRPPGDEVVPSDLRVDHVYLVSCKYLSRILHNASPARLVHGLLATDGVDDAGDWYERVAPEQYRALYERCVEAAGAPAVTGSPAELGRPQRRALAAALRGSWPPGALEHYQELCRMVSERTAEVWASSIKAADAELVLWRLLRIGSAPYFVLGSSPAGAMRLRIDTPWDWRRRFRFRGLRVEPQEGGQPRVGWEATYELRRSGELRSVRGHVEIRWSHGRFAQPPEAKVYLDSAHEDVPGYHPL